MNKTRRNKLKEIISALQTCYDDLNSLKDDEDYARENVPENLQGSEAYTASEGSSDTMEDALSDIQGVIDSLENI